MYVQKAITNTKYGNSHFSHAHSNSNNAFLAESFAFPQSDRNVNLLC